MKAENKEKDKKVISKNGKEKRDKNKGYGYIAPEDVESALVHSLAIVGADDNLPESGSQIEKNIKEGIIKRGMKESMESVIESFVSELTPLEAAKIYKEGKAIKVELVKFNTTVDSMCARYDRMHSDIEDLLKTARGYGYRV